MNLLSAAARSDAELLWVLTLKDLRVRYRGAAFGCLWALFLPLFYAGMYMIAYGSLGVARVGGIGEVLIATAVLQWTAGMIGSAPMVFIRNIALLRRVRTRWSLHAAASSLCESAPFFAALPVVLIALIAEGRAPSPMILVYGPALALAQASTLAGWAMVAASVNVAARDVERMSAPLATALFFATPVAFPLSSLPAWAWPWLMLNPAAVFVTAWRQALAGGIDARLAVAIALHVAAGLAAGVLVERAMGPRLPEFL